MAKIKQITAREILNSKGNPTIETTIFLDNETIATASSPSGTSVSQYEAVDLRDNDPKRFQGQGVLKAIENVENLIAPKLIGMDPTNQQEIDKTILELDKSENKQSLGGNATLSVSMAVAKAGAKSTNMSLFLYLNQFIKQVTPKLPTPMFNLINGGKHGTESLDFQEFLVIPGSSKTYSQCLEIGDSIYMNLKKILKTNHFSTLIGDEGGFGPKVTTNAEALTLLVNAINSSSLQLSRDVFLGLDIAATTFQNNKVYNLQDKQAPLTSGQLQEVYLQLIRQFHLIYLEDPYGEDDWDGWTNSFQALSQTILTGDDLIATNPNRLQTALSKKAISGVIIKPNQIGTVIETLAVVAIAKEAGIKVIVSHRSGETNDDFIADFAVAVAADYVKFGAPARGERVAKYNRLLEIETLLKKTE